MFLMNWVKFSIILFLIVGCEKTASLPYYNTPDFTPLFLKPSEVKKKITHTIPDFSFLNQDSIVFSSNSLKNKIHVANFIFTTCTDICPVMTSNMKPLEKFFFNDPLVSLLSFSVTPWIDGPNKLKNYAKFYDINSSNWIFLTGSKSKIYELARKSYFAEEDFGFSKDSTEFLHSEYFILVDNNKNIRGVYNGTLRLEVEQLEKDIIELKASL